MSDTHEAISNRARELFTRLVQDINGVRTRLHTALTAHEHQSFDMAAVEAETARLRANRGRENEAFRDDLILFILDYNRMARDDLPALLKKLTPLGLALPRGIDMPVAQEHLCSLLETAAVHITTLPAEPLDMIDNLTRHLRAAPPQDFSVESVSAHQIIHMLLSGEKQQASE